VPIALARRGIEAKLVVDAPGASPADRAADPALVKEVARGYAWFEELTSGRAASITAIATREDLTDRYVTRLLDLAFLPPTLIDDILNGRQPVDMTAERLSRAERGMVWRSSVQG